MHRQALWAFSWTFTGMQNWASYWIALNLNNSLLKRKPKLKLVLLSCTYFVCLFWVVLSFWISIMCLKFYMFKFELGICLENFTWRRLACLSSPINHKCSCRSKYYCINKMKKMSQGLGMLEWRHERGELVAILIVKAHCGEAWLRTLLISNTFPVQAGRHRGDHSWPHSKGSEAKFWSSLGWSWWWIWKRRNFHVIHR